RQQIEALTVPFYPVPGNHDVITSAAEKVYIEEWGADRLIYSFDWGPVHGIVLNTYYEDDDERIAEWQREWLKIDLADYAARNGGLGSQELESKSIFVFLHAPLWRPTTAPLGQAD